MKIVTLKRIEYFLEFIFICVMIFMGYQSAKFAIKQGFYQELHFVYITAFILGMHRRFNKLEERLKDETN